MVFLLLSYYRWATSTSFLLLICSLQYCCSLSVGIVACMALVFSDFVNESVTNLGHYSSTHSFNLSVSNNRFELSMCFRGCRPIPAHKVEFGDRRSRCLIFAFLHDKTSSISIRPVRYHIHTHTRVNRRSFIIAKT